MNLHSKKYNSKLEKMDKKALLKVASMKENELCHDMFLKISQLKFIYSEKATKSKILQNLHLTFDWHYIGQK